MTYTTDNRWSPGSSGALVPLTTRAAYSARWIDRGEVADIVPDRQGVAYNDPQDRELLFAALGRTRPHTKVVGQPDVTTNLVDEHDLVVRTRRSGGYVYVDAWLPEGGQS